MMSGNLSLAEPGPSHHVHDELLLDYASGSTSEPESLLVATHLAYCPSCRATVRGMEDVGGAMLEGVVPAAVSEGTLAAVMARIEGEPPAVPRALEPSSPGAVRVPEPLRGYLGGDLLGGDLDNLPWRRTMRGLHAHEVRTGRPDMKTRLLRIRAGTPMPEHTHRGQEFTLVLSGAYFDTRGRFSRGDIDITDASIQHGPVAEAGEDCVCLTLTQAPLRLTGPLGRLLNPFIRF